MKAECDSFTKDSFIKERSRICADRMRFDCLWLAVRRDRQRCDSQTVVFSVPFLGLFLGISVASRHCRQLQWLPHVHNRRTL